MFNVRWWSYVMATPVLDYVMSSYPYCVMGVFYYLSGCLF